MSSEQSESATDHLEVTHCPLCGERIEPYHAYSKKGKVRIAVECERHGDLEVTVSDQ